MLTALPRAEFLPEEWWNGDKHLAHLIGSMALLHRDIGNTYPSELEADEWHRILTRIGEPLLAYAAHDTDVDDLAPQRRAAAKQALELFSHWFDKFCD